MTSNTANLSLWVEKYTEDLYKWAFHKLSNAELARDFVQDTFLAAAEKSDTFEGKSSPKTWLFSILNHKIIDYYRKKVNQPVSMENQSFLNFFDDNESWNKNKKPHQWKNESDSHLLDDEEFRTVLKECLNALPEQWNICVKLKYLMEKKGEEICQELDITPSNFWQIIHRAKLKLRDCIENNWYNE